MQVGRLRSQCKALLLGAFEIPALLDSGFKVLNASTFVKGQDKEEFVLVGYYQ